MFLSHGGVWGGVAANTTEQSGLGACPMDFAPVLAWGNGVSPVVATARVATAARIYNSYTGVKQAKSVYAILKKRSGYKRSVRGPGARMLPPNASRSRERHNK